MNARETTLDAVNERGDGVRVGFRRIGDRFAHTLYGVLGGESLAIVKSVDDADDQGWPLSIPVQELREANDAEGKPTILLMGAAAAGHWSASVAIAQRGDRDPYLAFDVAVRLARPATYLGVAYDVDDQSRWVDLPGALAIAQRDQHALWITAGLDGPTSDATGKNPFELLQACGDARRSQCRRFQPTAPLPTTFPATYRWRYEISHAAAATSPARSSPAL
jgi:hypothetical protein